MEDNRPATFNQSGTVDCSDCKRDCKHRECFRRNPKHIGGLGLCPRLHHIGEAKEMWEKGTIRVRQSAFKYWIKLTDAPTERGIYGGRILLIILEKDGVMVCNTDRGWEIKPTGDAETAVEILKSEFN